VGESAWSLRWEGGKEEARETKEKKKGEKPHAGEDPGDRQRKKKKDDGFRRGAVSFRLEKGIRRVGSSRGRSRESHRGEKRKNN